MSTEHQPIPPAALLRENKTLLRQAAYYYMETDPEQKRIATETLMRLTFGEYPSAMIDAIFQRGPGRQPDLYDAFFLAQFIDAFNQGQLIAGSFDLPHPPARRSDIAENQRRLADVTMMGDELADVTTGVPARFTALYHGGHAGRSFGDGTLGWNGPITLTTQNIETGEMSTHGLPPAQCVLLARTASIYDVRYLLKNQGMVARWPRGRAGITLLVKIDSGLWHPRMPGDALETIERLSESMLGEVTRFR